MKRKQMRFKRIRKRRRSAVTNYAKRISVLKGDTPRVVVRKSNRGILMQIVNYEPDGDKVVVSVSSNALKKMEWPARSNTPTAYLTGLLLGQASKKLNIGSAVLDIGLYKPGKASVLFAAAKGAVDGGLKIPNSIEFDEKRLSGQHIAEYAKTAKPGQFSEYSKSKVDVQKLAELFSATKKKIIGK